MSPNQLFPIITPGSIYLYPCRMPFQIGNSRKSTGCYNNCQWEHCRRMLCFGLWFCLVIREKNSCQAYYAQQNRVCSKTFSVILILVNELLYSLVKSTQAGYCYSSTVLKYKFEICSLLEFFSVHASLYFSSTTFQRKMYFLPLPLLYFFCKQNIWRVKKISFVRN